MPLNTQEDKDFYAAIQDLGKKVFGPSGEGRIKSAFLDGSDAAKEKDWRDSKNNKITYFNWESRQPDNSGGQEDYLHIHKDWNGKWNDCPLNYADWIICQKDLIGEC